MIKLRVSQYINRNLVDHDMTYKALSTLSGVPVSTIHAYAQGKTTSPNEDNLIRIAAAFGDGPDVIYAMHRESLPAIADENLLIAHSDDKELMEKYADLIRSTVSQILDEYRSAASSQQTEIITHADQRVEDERRRARERCDAVLAQCLEEVERQKQHNASLLALKDDMLLSVRQDRDKSLSYLSRVVRNLTIALIVVSLLAVSGLAVLGGYAVYAYHTFDRADPTRGLYQTEITAP